LRIEATRDHFVVVSFLLLRIRWVEYNSSDVSAVAVGQDGQQQQKNKTIQHRWFDDENSCSGQMGEDEQKIEEIHKIYI
jgi:hypothetical protein